MPCSDRYGDAKISQHRSFEMVFSQEDVAWCHVAMHKSLLMYRVERKENAPQDHGAFLFIEELVAW